MIALIVSACLNLLFVGLIVGVMVKVTRDGPAQISQYFGLAGIAGMAASLNEHDLTLLRHDVARLPKDFRKGRTETAADLDKTLVILTSEPFSRADLDASFAAQRRAMMLRLEKAHELIGNRFSQMSAEERARFADRLANHYHHRRNHKH